MKNITSLLIISSWLLFIGISCEESNSTPKCIKGVVAGYEPCTGAILVDVLDSDIGNQANINDSVFDNVIRSSIPSPKYSIGQTIYFNYRSFKAESDNNLFNPDNNDHSCLQYSVDPLDVPTLVITQSSTSKCPDTYETDN